ncbi:hypothetical protein LMG23992_04472 [Cupriavidus laharis]|uniref:Lipoprotein n=1 Tax=Cupriavidus laharis TaxID=151654 RepID=A0ABM8XM39_9BURK|nr:hypothetical protein [Cupriavidus laharis]CAG9181306.1 hypothetical protein LMG23992_04472 [Cupriavidus laharis]
MKKNLLLAAMLGAVLALSGCGGGGDDNASGSTQAGNNTSAPPSTSGQPPAADDKATQPEPVKLFTVTYKTATGETGTFTSRPVEEDQGFTVLYGESQVIEIHVGQRLMLTGSEKLGWTRVKNDSQALFQYSTTPDLIDGIDCSPGSHHSCVGTVYTMEHYLWPGVTSGRTTYIAIPEGRSGGGAIQTHLAVEVRVVP